MENDKKPDFEKKLGELNKIVEKLESDVSLEEGVKLFESGLALTKECIDELNKTQDKINSLKKQLDDLLVVSTGGSDEH